MDIGQPCGAHEEETERLSSRLCSQRLCVKPRPTLTSCGTLGTFLNPSVPQLLYLSVACGHKKNNACKVCSIVPAQ